MTSPLIECIPNFSEARRPEVIDAIISTLESVEGISVLDHHSDQDHNRTVVTFVGNPEAVEEAAFQAIRKAQELIDLDQHTGAHPRIGATDVVPFVPISDVTMAECVEMARRLGKRVGTELSIPVYLYEEAATRPDRQNLENIRKGQYEGLKAEIGSKPDRQPDYGPEKMGKAGATVIGARAPLIAFNVYLTTSDLEIAQKIARAVRNSSGGFRYVKGMGVLVDGLAQVSMNLTDFHKTPIFRVVEFVRREAQRFGVGIHHTELVGLLPQAALVDTAVWYTQMDQFDPNQILESRLYAVQSASTGDTVNKYSFIDELASGNPTPGGGSAAAFTAAQAAALVAMVARVTVGKKKYAHVEMQMLKLIEKAEALKTTLIGCVQEDADSFDGYIQATRLPKGTDEEINRREKAVEAATLHAAKVPRRVAGLAMEVLRMAIEAAELGNVNAISDAASAAHLAVAAVKGAGLNVMINQKGLKNPSVIDDMVKDLVDFETETIEIGKRLASVLQERAGL